jgi:RimJ/RimL family protein N-acetyltransferase
MKPPTDRGYPHQLECAGGAVQIRLLTPADEAAVLAFAQRLSTHDLLFLRRDISQPRVVSAWMEATRRGKMLSLVAMRGDTLHGCATLVRDELSWSPHVGELRVIVEAPLRGLGVGQKLTRECFAIALDLGLEKLTALMTVDQPGAIAVFEGLGFQPEALFRQHVKDREGKTHDLIALSHDVASFSAQRAAYGIDQAL